MERAPVPHITCEHLQTLSKKGQHEHVIVDLRAPLAFESGHIKGSLNVPRKELETNIANLVPETGKRVIVVVGATHEDDIEAIHQTLGKLGYDKVEFLAGGFDAWCEIAPLDVNELAGEETPEEEGFTGEELSHIDPEESDNEPLY